MIDPAEAVCALYAMTARSGGWIAVRCRQQGATITMQHECGSPSDGARLAHAVRVFDQRFNDELAVTLPRPHRGWETLKESLVLWCRIEGRDQEVRARRFHPRPSLVLQEGDSTRRLLLWALTEPVGWLTCRDANRKLAYHLRAVQKWSDPDALEIPVPGSFLRVGRSKPVPVICSRLEADFYGVDRVVGRLREPPPVDAWRERAA
jgi:hypothetical protein